MVRPESESAIPACPWGVCCISPWNIPACDFYWTNHPGAHGRQQRSCEAGASDTLVAHAMTALLMRPVCG